MPGPFRLCRSVPPMIRYNADTNRLEFVSLTSERQAAVARSNARAPGKPDMDSLPPDLAFEPILVHQCPYCGYLIRTYWLLGDDRKNRVDLSMYISSYDLKW